MFFFYGMSSCRQTFCGSYFCRKYSTSTILRQQVQGWCSSWSWSWAWSVSRSFLCSSGWSWPASPWTRASTLAMHHRAWTFMRNHHLLSRWRAAASHSSVWYPTSCPPSRSPTTCLSAWASISFPLSLCSSSSFILATRSVISSGCLRNTMIKKTKDMPRWACTTPSRITFHWACSS